MMRSPPPLQVPTLTEVVLPTAAAATGSAAATGRAGMTPEAAQALAAEIDALVEQRLTAAFEAAWRQLLPALIDATRGELASSLREVIQRAVAGESPGHREDGLVRSNLAACSTGADAPKSAGLPR